MLYKFKSNVAGDLIMLEANGRSVLQIIGKDADSAGIILPEQMPAAMLALSAAINSEEALQRAALAKAQARGYAPPRLEAISLRKRAWPLVEMLQRCAKESAPITWGV